MALTNGGRRITLITICTLHRHIEVVPDRFYSLGRGRPQRLQFRELTAKTRGGCFWLPDLIAQHLELALARWSSHWLYFGETQPALNAFTCIHSLTHSLTRIHQDHEHRNSADTISDLVLWKSKMGQHDT